MSKHLIYFLLSALLALLVFSSCGQQRKKYVIGVSQCSEDSWRSKLEAELVQSTYFNEDVELRVFSANDDVEQQRKQIQELVDDDIDLLIVSPQQTSSLSSAIKKATEKKIPVVLFDRKSDIEDYTAYMGADNYAIGQMMGEYVASKLGYSGTIVEIAGERGSSPAIDRHNGFNEAIQKYSGLTIVGFAEGDWKQASGERAMNKILSEYSGRIDCVFGGNDRMTLGARYAIERYKQVHPNSGVVPNSILYIGVDALPTSGGGIEKVNEGVLTASAIYPTHGDELMNLALCILKHEPFEKQNTLETSIVTSANANVLLMQYKEVVKQDEYIQRMHKRVDTVVNQLDIQRIFIWFIIIVAIIICILLVVSIRGYRAKLKLNEQLHKKNEELNAEKERVERQRDELEEQRDRWLDATTNDDDESDVSDEMSTPKNEFLDSFLSCIEKRLADSDLSVEDVGQEMCLSRVQLYRKVKTATGKTPVEIIREERLKRANILLADSSLSISEIAYRVGFSAPSYFTKCYKDYYGKSPKSLKN